MVVDGVPGHGTRRLADDIDARIEAQPTDVDGGHPRIIDGRWHPTVGHGHGESLALVEGAPGPDRQLVAVAGERRPDAVDRDLVNVQAVEVQVESAQGLGGAGGQGGRAGEGVGLHVDLQVEGVVQGIVAAVAHLRIVGITHALGASPSAATGHSKQQ